LSTLAHPLPGLRHSLGRAYLALGKPDEAIRVLPTDEGHASGGDDGILEACAQYATGNETEAIRVWSAASARRASASEVAPPAFEKLVQILEGQQRPRALLVGIDRYYSDEIPKPRGAVADIKALASVLKQRWGYRDEDLTILIDEAATRHSILDGFHKIVQESRERPCLFAFSGVGSDDPEDTPAILAVDSRSLEVYDDIDLTELAQEAKKGGTQLVSICSVGWCSGVPKSRIAPELRYAPTNRLPRMKSRELSIHRERSLDRLDLFLGRLSIFDDSISVAVSNQMSLIVESERSDPRPGAQEPGRVFSRLFHAIVEALWRIPILNATWHDVIDDARRDSIGLDPDPPRFTPVILPLYSRDETPIRFPVLRYLRRLEFSPIQELISRLRRLAEKQERPEHYLNLGIAQAAVGALSDARKSLESARDHEQVTPPMKAEAHYHLGRVLFDTSELEAAISELKAATALDPDLAGAHFYLGRALRDYARFDLKELSDKAFRAYLAAGAPLGKSTQVRDWLTAGPDGRTASSTR
jgi:hypothetical protein